LDLRSVTMPQSLREKLDAALLVHGDCDLSTTGEKQLKFKLTVKPELFEALPVDEVFSSPLRSALKTALIAYPTHKIVVLPELREVDANAGLCQAALHAFVEKVSRNREAEVDLSKVPAKPWWHTASGAEKPDAVKKRVQGVLKTICKTLSTRKERVAIVSHGGVIREMCGEMKPFPEVWAHARAFPMNFRPYAGTLVAEDEGVIRVRPAASGKEATVLLVRHAHSRAEAALTLQKDIKRYRAAPKNDEKVAAKLEKKIRLLNSRG
jgi:broad specificity phosphatase PhoE